jgi:hypothetical protein
MIVFPDPNVETEYTDPNGAEWEFNGTGWVRKGDCPDGGDAGGGPTSPTDPWPLPPAPAKDLLSVGNEIYEVGGDGSLSLYAAISGVSYACGIQWGNYTTQLFAYSPEFSNEIQIRNYSTPDLPLVHQMGTLTNVAGGCWGSLDGDVRIFLGGGKSVQVLRFRNDVWESWAGPLRIEGMPDFDEFFIDEDGNERFFDNIIINGGIKAPRGIAYNPGSPNSFVSAVSVSSNAIADNHFQCQAKSGSVEVEVGMVPSERNPSQTAKVSAMPYSIDHHPYEGFVIWAGQSVNCDSAIGYFNLGSAVVDYGGKKYGSTSNYATPEKITANSCTFSPSGNYFCVSGSSNNDPLYIYKFLRNGRMILVDTMPNNIASGVATNKFGQWSADEKYFYVWSGTQKIYCFDFSEGKATDPREVVSQTVEAAWVDGNSRFNRSKV